MGGPGDACQSRRRLSARPACRSRARRGGAVVMHQRGRGHSAPRPPSCWHSGCSPGSHSLTERPSARPRPTCRVPAEEETGDGAWVAAHHDTRSAGAAQLREASFEEKEGLRKLDTWDPPHGVVVSERSALLLSQQRVDRNSGLALSPNLTARSQPPRQTGSVPGVRSPAMGTGGARTHCSRPRHSRPNAPDAGPLSTSAPAHVGVGAERVHVSPSPSPPPRTGLCFPSGTMWSGRAGATGSAAPPSLWRQGHKPCSGGTRGQCCRRHPEFAS